ncbi:MAG: hypothetical protein AAB692_01360 [Patescibacteria group bacterium]
MFLNIIAFLVGLLVWFKERFSAPGSQASESKFIAAPCTTCGKDDKQGTGILLVQGDAGRTYTVCPACGGLGMIIDDDGFRRSREAVRDACHLVRNPEPGYPPPPPCVAAARMVSLAQAITRHYRDFGQGIVACFAESVTKGALAEDIMQWVVLVNAGVEQVRTMDLGAVPEREACRTAWMAAHIAEFDAADGLFMSAAVMYPESSIVAHDYGVYLINFRRNREEAMPWLEWAAARLPADVRYAYAAGHNAAALQRLDEARFFFETAATFDDRTGLPPDARAWINQFPDITATRTLQ